MKTWSKTVKFENREFLITFWYDYWNFFYTQIEEKVARKPTLFNRKDYEYQPLCNKYWIDELERNPIEVALSKIQSCLETEKALNELEKMLDEFCK